MDTRPVIQLLSTGVQVYRSTEGPHSYRQTACDPVVILSGVQVDRGTLWLWTPGLWSSNHVYGYT